MKLIEVLRTKEKEDELFSKLEKIKAKAKPKLEEIAETFSSLFLDLKPYLYPFFFRFLIV
jgi:hypothetical protein